MKIGSIRNNPIAPLGDQRGKLPAGSLIVSDAFNPSQPTDPDTHGGAVVAGARSLGFQGPIFFQQSTTVLDSAHREGRLALEQLATRPLAPEETEQAISAFAVGAPIHMLNSATQEIERTLTTKPHNSVLNLSSGTSKAQVTQILYKVLQGPQALQNVSKLWGIDSDAIQNIEPEVSGRAKRLLQQEIVNAVELAWQEDSRIENGQKKFWDAVSNFEANNNSVVVAAGNEGFVRPILEMDGKGELKLPTDFEKNVLSNPDTTTVGATIQLDGEEVKATFTSGDQPIQAYASGDHVIGREFDDKLGLRGAGTSIATPRIAAVMAKLHQDQPHLNSRQVEQLLRDDYLKAPIPLLDHDKANLYLTSGDE